MGWVSIDRLETDPDLSSLFPIESSQLEAVYKSIVEDGFSEAEPISVWQNYIIVDGHTRLEAAKKAGESRVFIYNHDFADKREALEYAIARQRDRRNLTKKQIDSFVARAIAALDRVGKSGERTDLASPEARLQSNTRSGKSAAATAERVSNLANLSVSRATVERARKVLKEGNEEIKEKLLSGEVSPSAAYRAVVTPKPRSTKLQGRKVAPSRRGPAANEQVERAIFQLEVHSGLLAEQIDISELTGDEARTATQRLSTVSSRISRVKKRLNGNPN